jgi:hypothetical protein
MKYIALLVLNIKGKINKIAIIQALYFIVFKKMSVSQQKLFNYEYKIAIK